jgi:hypothetical protein
MKYVSGRKKKMRAKAIVDGMSQRRYTIRQSVAESVMYGTKAKIKRSIAPPKDQIMAIA